MLFTTPTQYIVLALMLVVGWLFGYASNSGASKWKRKGKAAEADLALYRKETDTQLRDAKRRIADLEAKLETERRARPVEAVPVETAPGETVRVAPAPAPEPAPIRSGSIDDLRTGTTPAAASAARPAFPARTGQPIDDRDADREPRL